MFRNFIKNLYIKLFHSKGWYIHATELPHSTEVYYNGNFVHYVQKIEYKLGVDMEISECVIYIVAAKVDINVNSPTVHETE